MPAATVMRCSDSSPHGVKFLFHIPLSIHFSRRGLFPAVPEDVTLIFSGGGRKGKGGGEVLQFEQEGKPFRCLRAREGRGGTREKKLANAQMRSRERMSLKLTKVSFTKWPDQPEGTVGSLHWQSKIETANKRPFQVQASFPLPTSELIHTQFAAEQARGDHAEQVHPIRPPVPPGNHPSTSDEH